MIWNQHIILSFLNSILNLVGENILGHISFLQFFNAFDKNYTLKKLKLMFLFFFINLQYSFQKLKAPNVHIKR